MLVLTRKTEQRIQIGQNITITILRIKGNSVKVGIEAPEGVEVVRTELLARQAHRSENTAPLAEEERHTAEQASEHGQPGEPAAHAPVHRRARDRKAALAAIAACWAM